MAAVFEAFGNSAAEFPPEVVLVLGSGMGTLVERVETVASVPYTDIPGLVSTGVQGHRGRLTLARWVGRVVLLCEGRLHYYEGHSWDRVTALVGLAASFGVRAALLTNA